MSEKPSYAALAKTCNGNIATLFKLQPELAKGWGALKGAAITEGEALNAKTRELIALAIAVGTQCEPCVAFHAQACVQYGATRQEVSEMLTVCIMMGGGPSLMYAGKALAAFDEFTALKA